MRRGTSARQGGTSEPAKPPAALSQLGHELRTPAQVIRGFAALLLGEQAGALTPEQRHFVQQIARSGEHVARLAAELGAGEAAATLPVRPEHTSLASLVESAGAAMKLWLDPRRQSLTVSIGPGAAFGCFDPVRIEQVLLNLIANASEHGPEGGRIDLDVERCERSGRSELRVSVSDEGPGLRTAPRRAGERPGRGLGLDICREIIAAHGGRFSLDEVPGRGARASFTVPAADESAS